MEIARNEICGQAPLSLPQGVPTSSGRISGQYHSFDVFHLDPAYRYSSDAVQFRQANKALQERLKTDPAFRRKMFGKYPGLAQWSSTGDMGKRLHDVGLVWHHDPNSLRNNGTFDLQLCDWNDHYYNPSVYNDENGQGGRSVWGGGHDGRIGHLDQNGKILPKYE